MVSAFTPFLDRDAIPWYVQMLEQFKDMPQHRSVMVAKIHLADLLHRSHPRQYDQEINRLFREALSVPAEQIVFDHPDLRDLNVAAIESAVSPELGGENAALLQSDAGRQMAQRMNISYREQLRQRRAEQVLPLRKSAAAGWFGKKVEPGIPSVTRMRLASMKREFADDTLYQSALDEAIGQAEQLSGRPPSAQGGGDLNDRAIRGFGRDGN